MSWKLWTACYAATVILCVIVAITGNAYLLSAQLGAQAVLFIAVGWNAVTSWSKGRSTLVG